MNSYIKKQKKIDSFQNKQSKNQITCHLIIFTAFDLIKGGKMQKKNVMMGRQKSCARERAKEHKMFSNTRRNSQLGPHQRIGTKLHRKVGDL